MMAFLASLAVIDGELRADGYTMHLGSLPSWISAATAIIAVGMIFVRIGKRDQQIDSLAESNKQLAAAISGLSLGIVEIRAVVVELKTRGDEFSRRMERVERQMDETR